MVQHLFPHGFQLPAQVGPVSLFQQRAQEVIPCHAAACLAQRILHRIVTPGAHGGVLVAHLEELLLHVQLLLAQHTGEGRFGLCAGQPGLIQPLAAEFHSLFQTALQQAHVQGELCVAGVPRLPPGPEADAGLAVAQPGAAQGVQLAGRVARSVQLVQHIGQQVEILHFFGGQPAEVVVDVQIQTALGRMVQQLRTGHAAHDALGAGAALAQVCHRQRMVQCQLAVGTGRGCIGFFRFGQGRHLNDLHRRSREQLPQQVVEPAGGHLLPQGSEELVRVEQQGRVPGVEPAGRCMDGVQHTVGQAARPLQRGELCRVQAGQQQIFRDALGQDVVHGAPDPGRKPACGLFGGTAQHQFQRGLQRAVVKADVDVGPQLLFQKRSLQRRLVRPQQRIQQDLHAQLAFPVGKCAGVPGQRTLHLVGLRLFGIVRNVHADARLLVLQRQSGLAGALGHPAQVVFIQEGQFFGHIHPAVQGHTAVVGAVMAAVHPLVLLIGQRRDGGRVAAGHKAVGRIREHRPLQRILQLCIRGGQRALHLVVDDAAHGAVGIAVPALLLEHSPVHHGQRAEHRVQVDVHQVPEVGLVGGGEGVDRLVREGHRVQEGRHAALEQLQKRRGHRVLFAARQHRVLQNVEHTRVIRWEGAEADAECLVRIFVLHQQDGRTADIVGQHGQGTVLFGAVLAAHDGITGILLHWDSPFSNGFLFIVSRCAVRRNKQSIRRCSLLRAARQ